jgi:hypothetical protein
MALKYNPVLTAIAKFVERFPAGNEMAVPPSHFLSAIKKLNSFLQAAKVMVTMTCHFTLLCRY